MRVIARSKLKSEKGIGYSDVHLRRMEKSGQFPKSFALGGPAGGQGRRAYDEAEIDAWLKERRDTARTVSEPANKASAA